MLLERSMKEQRNNQMKNKIVEDEKLAIEKRKQAYQEKIQGNQQQMQGRVDAERNMK